MNPRQRILHALSSLLLIGLGVTLVYFYVSGRIIHYTAPLFRWGALAGGIIMTVLGLFNLFTSRVAAACSHDHDEPGPVPGPGCDHGHHGEEDGGAADSAHDRHHADHSHDETTPAGMAAGFLLILAPIITASAFTKDAYVGSDAAENKGLYENRMVAPPPPAVEEADPLAFTKEDLKKQVDQNAEGDFILSIQAIYYSAGDPELMRVLEGEPVEVEGEVVPEKYNNASGKRMRLFRWFVQCCAADAMPLGIPIEFPDQAPDHPEQTWLRVHGNMSYDKQEGMDVPVIKVRKAEKIDPPAERMMY